MVLFDPEFPTERGGREPWKRPLGCHGVVVKVTRARPLEDHGKSGRAPVSHVDAQCADGVLLSKIHIAQIVVNPKEALNFDQTEAEGLPFGKTALPEDIVPPRTTPSALAPGKDRRRWGADVFRVGCVAGVRQLGMGMSLPTTPRKRIPRQEPVIEELPPALEDGPVGALPP